MNGGSANFFLLMMLVVAMMALTNFLNIMARDKAEKEHEAPGDIKVWHIVLFIAVFGLCCIAYAFYSDYKRENYKGYFVSRFEKTMEIRRIETEPETGNVSILLDTPGWEARRGSKHASNWWLVASFTKPCSTIDLLNEGTPVTVTVVARRYQKSFPTGYYETVENPDSLCP